MLGYKNYHNDNPTFLKSRKKYYWHQKKFLQFHQLMVNYQISLHEKMIQFFYGNKEYCPTWGTISYTVWIAFVYSIASKLLQVCLMILLRNNNTTQSSCRYETYKQHYSLLSQQHKSKPSIQMFVSLSGTTSDLVRKHLELCLHIIKRYIWEEQQSL